MTKIDSSGKGFPTFFQVALPKLSDRWSILCLQVVQDHMEQRAVDLQPVDNSSPSPLPQDNA